MARIEDTKPREPRGELGRYAFGYSDQKPGVAFWVILAVMVAYILIEAQK